MPKSYNRNYAKTKKRKIFKRFFSVVLILIIAVAILFLGKFLANLLTGELYVGTNKIKINKTVFYALCFGEFETENDARKCAVWLENAGGAGYIYKGEKYIVVARTYEQESDAKKVLENIGTTTYDGCVKTFTTKTKNIKIKNLKKIDKKNILNCVRKLDEVVGRISEIDIGIDTNGLTNVSGANNLNTLKTKVGEIRLTLIETNKYYANSAINGLITYCNMILDDIDLAVNKLLVSTNEASVCKYLLTNIQLNYYTLFNNM